MTFLTAFGLGLAQGAGEVSAFALAGLLLVHIYRTYLKGS